MQLLAFFYFLTFDEKTSRGYFWKEGPFYISTVRRTDWGNVLQKSFAKSVKNWELRLNLSTAMGYYRAVIRKHPTEDCWSWALEWNRNFRTVGFFGKQSVAKETGLKMEKLDRKLIVRDSNTKLFYRIDEQLADEEDELFI